MSKAVLVMDMPKDCYECKLQDWLTCRIAKKCNTSHSIPDWCPLRELPKKITSWKGKSTNYQQGHRDGYNACIDELLKGEEG